MMPKVPVGIHCWVFAEKPVLDQLECLWTFWMSTRRHYSFHIVDNLAFNAEIGDHH